MFAHVRPCAKYAKLCTARKFLRSQYIQKKKHTSLQNTFMNHYTNFDIFPNNMRACGNLALPYFQGRRVFFFFWGGGGANFLCKVLGPGLGQRSGQKESFYKLT